MIQSLIQIKLDQALTDCEDSSQPKKFVLLNGDLTYNKGDLTIHGQMCVADIEGKYQELIEAMYR